MAAPKMGPFERGQRYTGLTKQAQLFYEQHRKDSQSCEESAKTLFGAVKAIIAAQGTTWDQVFDLPDAFMNNIVFDGGLQHHGPATVGKFLSHAQWFFLCSLVGLRNASPGASSLFYYISATLCMEPLLRPLYARMPLGSCFRLARVPESPFLYKRILPWARLGRFFQGEGKHTVRMIGMELFDGDITYEDSTKFIHDVAHLRLNACAHSTIMKAISDNISKLATKAAKHAEDPETALSFDIRKQFDAVAQSLITAYGKVPNEVMERVGDYDRIYQKKYLGQDPDLTDFVFELKKAAPTNIIRLDISHAFAVNTLLAETGAYDGALYGKYHSGENDDKIFLEDDELITGATWKKGSFAKNTKNKLIFNLIITTTKRTLGPFGTGGDEIRGDSVKEESFEVPDKMKVCGIIDLASEFIEHRGDVILENGPYIADLRFLVTLSN
ncbi:hypothetical protein CEP54_014738 [Fusarium duplospermum]|uniref:Jacalin-type lectin domain-containing protein n=1 Tax=Fusarium duplospermum TaxID=1325734 RepID=A0A428NU50_9HYPO|nr:hypothetical protein CEP54_014738 [Fusarium duplospermum]